jgi:undecaprenyl diphosphate synthase
MDGSGRWAEARGQPRLSGHAQGVRAARAVIAAAAKLGIPVLSLYAFSAQNWRRPRAEVRGLMDLLREFLDAEAAGLAEEGVQVRLLGQREGLPPGLSAALSRAEALTAQAGRLVLNLAVNYGGQEELVQAVRALARETAAGRLPLEAVDRARLEAHLLTRDLPPVDLLIRTAGEQRLSNFLLWQSAYAELLFLDVLWPDFTPAHLEAALADYAHRRRTFGGLSDGAVAGAWRHDRAPTRERTS